jgi:glycosyltransferase involved in cell wall biosynthesis
MRILQVVHAFFPEHTGGTETQTLLLARALHARGHEVGVVYRIAEPELAEYTLLESDYEGLPTFKIVNNYTARPATPFLFHDENIDRPFLEVLTKFGPDLVHLHHLGGGLSTSLLAAAQRRGLPVVMTLHDFWYLCLRSHLVTVRDELCEGPEDGLKCLDCYLGEREAEYALSSVRSRTQELGLRSALRRLPHFVRGWVARQLASPAETATATQSALVIRDQLMRQLLARADLILAPSHSLRDRYVEWGIPLERIRYFPNGIAADLSPISRADDSPVRRFGYIGGFHPYKGLGVLIKAFNQLEELDVTLAIHGRASTPRAEAYAAELQAAVRNPRITFAGAFPPSQLAQVLAELDVLILPSTIYENNPMSILEAFAAGVPVIASNIGGMAELVEHDVNGLQFRAGSADDLAAKIRFANSNPERVRAYRANIVPPRTADEVGEAMEALYDTLLTADRYSRGAEIGHPGD